MNARLGSVGFVCGESESISERLPADQSARRELSPGADWGAQYNTAPGLPYPGFHSIDMSTNEANSHYNALQVDLNSRVRDLTLRAYYTLSRTVDPTLGGDGGADLTNVSNPYLGWKYDSGPGGYDRTHNAAVNFIYDIPFFRKSRQPPCVTRPSADGRFPVS